MSHVERITQCYTAKTSWHLYGSKLYSMAVVDGSAWFAFLIFFYWLFGLEYACSFWKERSLLWDYHLKLYTILVLQPILFVLIIASVSVYLCCNMNSMTWFSCLINIWCIMFYQGLLFISSSCTFNQGVLIMVFVIHRQYCGDETTSKQSLRLRTKLSPLRGRKRKQWVQSLSFFPI